MTIEESAGIVPSLVRNWARAYTFGLPSGIREERRAEIESDIWEQAHDSGVGLRRSLSVSRSARTDPPAGGSARRPALAHRAVQ